METYDGKKYIKIPISEWGYKKLVTLDLLKNYVNNDDYLLEQSKELWDSTPPVTRKLFKPLAVDENTSYGVVLNSNDEYTFYDKTDTNVLINFTDKPSNEGYVNNMIDTVHTTCCYDNNVITVPRKQVSFLDKNTRDYSPFTSYDSAGNPLGNDMTCNEFWYVGYDRNRVYETRPNWLMNEEHGGIPSICRAQTFKVNLKDKSHPYGVLESVVLNLHGEDLQYGVPLIVEITETVTHNGIAYPASRDHINNDRYNTTRYGDGRKAKQIAKQYWYPVNTNPGVVSITFDWGARVEDGQSYAIVLRSPLNHQPNPYSVGGWSKHCDPKTYKDGDAFMSSNNGYTWMRYGKREKVSYHQGMYAPEDFAFQCNIRQEFEEYESGDFEVYTQPIHVEGIETVQLSVVDESKDGNITYYAYNPVTGKWVEFDEYNMVSFNEERPDLTIIKAVLHYHMGGNPPYIRTMNVHLHHDLIHNACFRTLPYTPRTTGILSANTYSHVHCPYVVNDNVNDQVSVDVVKETVNYANLNIIPLLSIPEYDSVCTSVTEDVKKDIQTIISTKDESKKQELIKTFILTHEQLFKDLEVQSNTYVLENPSFGSFNITGDCAYPIIRCSLQPKDDVTVEFQEWVDYTVDYDTGDILTFNSPIVKELCEGTLTIMYKPVFAKNIPVTHFEDEEVADIDLGFIHETFMVTEEMLNNEVVEFVTKTEALNPLREVKMDDTVFVEGRDFSVDYDNKRILVKTGKLEKDRELSVKYTPYLVNESISLVYHLKRSNVGDKTNVRLKGNYIDYKT
jgi:hypothetical protein